MDVETEARALRDRAGYSEHDAPGAVAIARRLSIPIRRVDGRIIRGVDAERVKLHGRDEIFVRHGLTEPRLQWVVGHELGELRLAEIDYREPDIEQLADAFAAALLMPRAAFREAAVERGDDLAELALDFAVDQTATALRLAETRCAEAVVVVCPSRIYARGPEGFALPPERELRRGALAAMPGVRSVRLTDARRRTAYVAA